MSFVAGETVGSYRILEPLGQGGMASVFKAYHAALDRYVAIKVMHVAFNEDKNFLGRFQREARVVARLEHPNIVPIYDFAEHEGRPYLVMKYIEGETLKARLERGALAEAELLAVLDAVGAALGYAHRQGVLHRDVKPSNVLLASDGGVYLADFGLARIAQSGESSLTADRLVGTPQYISPEQALSKPDLDARTDVYSFGVMFYELLVGKVPFNADTPFSVIHDHIYTPLPLPRSVNPQVSEGVERVLLKSLAKDRNDRFADIPAMVAAMRAALTSAGLPGAGDGLAAGAIGPLAVNGVPFSGPTTLPFPALQAEPAVAPPVASADVSPVGMSPISPAPAARPKKKGRWIALGAGGVVVLLVVVLTLSLLRNANQQRLSSATQTAAATKNTKTPDAAQTGARADLSAALENWKRGDLAAATLRLNSAMKTAGDDAGFYRESLDYLMQNQAWLLAAVLVFSPDVPKSAQGLLNQRDRVQDLHQVLYMSASDPLSKDFLKRNADKIMYFRVAPIRYELIFGSPAKARQDLGLILGAPEQLKLYPEARLLEIEILQKSEPARARPRLDELLKDKDTLPEWVRLFALDLDQKIAK